MSRQAGGGGHDPKDLSPSEARRRLGGGISLDTIRRACRAGKLGYWFGGRWYITEAEIEAIRRREIDPWGKYA